MEHEEEEKYFKTVRYEIFGATYFIEHESKGDRNKTLSIEEYLRPYLKDIINNLKKSETWRILLTIANKFSFSVENGKIEIMINDKADKVLKKTVWFT